jgi:hypothetical protein
MAMNVPRTRTASGKAIERKLNGATVALGTASVEITDFLASKWTVAEDDRSGQFRTRR